MSERQQAMIRAYVEKQSLRLVAREFNVTKQTVHKAIIRAGKADILRRTGMTYKWERVKHRNKKNKMSVEEIQ